MTAAQHRGAAPGRNGTAPAARMPAQSRAGEATEHSLVPFLYISAFPDVTLPAQFRAGRERAQGAPPAPFSLHLLSITEGTAVIPTHHGSFHLSLQRLHVLLGRLGAFRL